MRYNAAAGGFRAGVRCQLEIVVFLECVVITYVLSSCRFRLVESFF